MNLKRLLSIVLTFCSFATGATNCGVLLGGGAVAPVSGEPRAAIVIVDPFGFRAGVLLPLYVKAMGMVPIVVLSAPDLPVFLTGDFNTKGEDVIIAVHDDAKTWEKIDAVAAKYGAKVKGVIPGTESGVQHADWLAYERRLPGNGIVSSSQRRDKVMQQVRLKQKGLAYAPSAHVSSKQQVLDFIKQEMPLFPRRRVVLKPVQSAGTDRVFLLKDPERFQPVLSTILDKPDAFGQSHSVAVAQVELEGMEYIFDTVSTQVMRKGELVTRHLAVGAWRYLRRASGDPERAPIIDTVEWVPFDKLPKGMAKYAFEVLDALEITHGPAHLEIMDTAQGPVLVELGARLPGGLPLIAAEVTGPHFNQIELAIAAYVDPERVAHLAEDFGGGYPTKGTAEIVFLSVEEDGRIKNPETLAEITKENFPTLTDLRVFGKDHEVLPITVDVTNALLRAHFSGTAEAVAKDRDKLRRLHRAGHFLKKP